MKTLFILLSLVACTAVQAGHQHLEKWYADALAEQLEARTEVRMRNGTRCDVLAASHAIEVDFGWKWHEAIGQSINYSEQTGRPAGIALIIEQRADETGLAILRNLILRRRVDIVLIVLRPFEKDGLSLEFPEQLKVTAKSPKNPKNHENSR